MELGFYLLIFPGMMRTAGDLLCNYTALLLQQQLMRSGLAAGSDRKTYLFIA